MNHFTYKDLFIGQSVEFSHNITTEMMDIVEYMITPHSNKTSYLQD